MRLISAIILSLVLAPSLKPAFGQDAPSPDSRVALVIGNASYRDAEGPLKDVAKYAKSLASELQRAGFDVDLGENLTKEAARRAFERFYGKIKADSVALVFFAGYAIQSNGQNYMLPVDAHVWTEAEVRREGFGVDEVLTQLGARGANTRIVILDASRRNPFERHYRLTSAGLTSSKPPRGSALLYSAAPGNLVDEARDNIFVAELITQMKAPHSTLDEVFGRTSAAVSRASGGTQTPWFASSLGEQFSFGPKPPQPESSASSPPPKAPPDESKIARNDEGTNGSNVAMGSEIKVARAEPQQDQTSARAPARAEIDPADATMIKTLDAKLQSNPRDALSLYTRGQLFAKSADFYRAATDFDAAIRLNPKDAAAYSNRCLARAMFLDLQVALQDCNEALRLRPNYPDALESRGLVHLKMGLANEAITDYDAALRIRPNRATALYGRGLGKLRMGKAAEGNGDIAAAKALNARVGDDFAGYGL
jgi:hypothetical protein